MYRSQLEHLEKRVQSLVQENLGLINKLTDLEEKYAIVEGQVHRTSRNAELTNVASTFSVYVDTDHLNESKEQSSAKTNKQEVNEQDGQQFFQSMIDDEIESVLSLQPERLDLQ